MRIFIGPIEIAGIANGLLRGFDELGIKARLVLSVKHPFGYGVEESSVIINFWQFLGKHRAFPKQSLVRKIIFVMLHRAFGTVVLFWALFKFDAFIFLFGRTLTDTRFELRILRWLKKKIIFINCGADIRPPYLDGLMFACSDAGSHVSLIAKSAARTKRRAVFQERFSDFIVAQPSIAHFYQKPIINYFSMGVPVFLNYGVMDGGGHKKSIRIVHSPSNPIVKGSGVICDVVQGLIDDGVPLDFICLQGVSNDVVLQQLSQCDFVVDQLYSDLPMAVLGVEAACFGKPCILAGYLADGLEKYIKKEDLPPSLYVHPSQLREAIKKLAFDEELRRNLGGLAQSFVSQRWACKVVAERYLALLKGRPDQGWWFDPASITYVGGCGMPLENTAKLVALIVDRYGRKALQVGDKPALEKALVELADQFQLGGKCA